MNCVFICTICLHLISSVYHRHIYSFLVNTQGRNILYYLVNAHSCIEHLGSRELQCRELEAVLINTSDSGARQGTAVRAQTPS